MCGTRRVHAACDGDTVTSPPCRWRSEALADGGSVNADHRPNGCRSVNADRWRIQGANDAAAQYARLGVLA